MGFEGTPVMKEGGRDAVVNEAMRTNEGEETCGQQARRDNEWADPSWRR